MGPVSAGASGYVVLPGKSSLMRSSNELFLLIKSMNRNEKGYFKKFAGINSKKGEGNYLRLFDCIDAMEVYNEALIKKKFAGEKFIDQLNVTKLYLQKMIIKSLRNYYGDNDPEVQRLNAMAEITLLFKKRLYDSALRQIEKVKAQLIEQELHLLYLHLVQMEFQIYLRKGMYEEILDLGESKLKAEKEALAIYENLCDYRYLQGVVMSRTQIEGHTRNESEKEIRKYITHPLLRDEKLAASFKARMHRLEILNKCYLKIGDYKKAHENAYEMRELFLSNPDKIRIAPYNYFVALNGLINRCVASLRYDEALAYVKEAEQLAEDERAQLSDSQRFEMRTQTHEKRLIVYAKTGQFEKGIETEKHLRLLVKDAPIRTELEVTTIYFSGMCYFCSGQLKTALDKVNMLIHGDFENIRKDIILCAHWMNVLIHFEFGNYSLMKRLFTVTRNFMKKHSFPMDDSEELFARLQDIVKAASSGNKDQVRARMMALYPTLEHYDVIDDDIMKWWITHHQSA